MDVKMSIAVQFALTAMFSQMNNALTTEPFKFLKDMAIVNRKIYGFCSKPCEKRFVKNPKAHLTKKDKL